MADMTNNYLLVKKLHEDAIVPIKSTNYAAGFDLHAIQCGVVPARGRDIISTGISIRIPRADDGGYIYGSIRSRSGLSIKYGIEVGAGVIDADYSGEVKIVLHNHSDEDFLYRKSDRIAQLILEKYATPPVCEVKELPPIKDNNRQGGFGSTGN